MGGWTGTRLGRDMLGFHMSALRLTSEKKSVKVDTGELEEWMSASQAIYM